MGRSKLKRVGRRLAVAGGVLLLAAAAVLAVNTLVFSDDAGLGPAPVRVQVLAPGTFESSHPYAPYYVVPGSRVASPAKLSRAATNRFVTRPEAALGKGALPGSPQVVRLALRSTTDEPVTVERVRFHVVSDARPVKGWFTAQPACEFERVDVARVNLDSRRRPVRYVNRDGKRRRSLSLALHRSRPAVLELHARTSRRRVAWTAQLSVRRDGAPAQTVTVDDGGRAFRVTAVSASRGYTPLFGPTGIAGFARERSWDRGVKGC
jgi:hypothetical protein